MSASASSPPRARIAQGQTTCADLSPASHFNTFVYGDHRIDNNNVFGRVAIGGNAVFNGPGAISLGSDLRGDSERFDLIVGGSIAASDNVNVTVQRGSVIHVGSITPPGSVNAPQGSVQQVNELRERVGADPFDFADTFEQLTALQYVWNDLPDQERITAGDIIGASSSNRSCGSTASTRG